MLIPLLYLAVVSILLRKVLSNCLALISEWRLHQHIEEEKGNVMQGTTTRSRDQPIPLQQHALPLANAPEGFKIIDAPQGVLQLIFTFPQPAFQWGPALCGLGFELWFIYFFFMNGLWLCYVPLLLSLCLPLVRFLGAISARYEYELHPDRLIFRQVNRWGFRRSTSIPKAWIRSIRVILKPGGAENPDFWTLELVWADQKVSLLPNVSTHNTTAQWLGTVIGTWAELGLVWQSSSGVDMLYQAGAEGAVAQPTRPQLTGSASAGQAAEDHLGAAAQPTRPQLTAVDISEDWQTAIVTLLLLGLFMFIYVEVTDSFFRVLSLSITGLFLFMFLLKLLTIAVLTYRFQQEGRETRGVITQCWIEYAPEPEKDQYWLAYQFPAGGETKVKVKPAIYAAHEVGDSILVRYLSTDPQISSPYIWVRGVRV